MKKIYTLIMLLSTFVWRVTNAQVLYNSSKTLKISAGASLTIKGNLINQSGSNIQNEGVINAYGNMTNRQEMTNATGTVNLLGTISQNVEGTNQKLWRVKNLNINNGNGVTFNGVYVDGLLSFNNGNVNSSYNFILSENATYTGASDSRHVKGSVSKEGTGAFIYPVGDGTKLQKIGVDIIKNEGFITAEYYSSEGDFGSDFTVDGTEPTPLIDYNKNEYWNLNTSNDAIAKITIYWDGYNDAGDAALNTRRVAKNFDGRSWSNEGDVASGDVNAGSVTSNELSDFGAFALGMIDPSALPVSFTSFIANAENNSVKLEWATANEIRNSHFIIERSADGVNFAAIDKIYANGDSKVPKHYQAYDVIPFSGSNYYRLKQVDTDGKESFYPEIRAVNFQIKHSTGLTIYPNPVIDNYTVYSDKHQEAKLINASGKVVQSLNLLEGNNKFNSSALPSGVYILRTPKQCLKLIKR